MATMTAMRRSTARRSRAASYSVDQVYDLLDKVNKITLKRLEDKIDAIAARDAEYRDSFFRLVHDTIHPMRADITAIKTRVGALTRGSTKGSKGRARKRSRSPTA